jgi:transposase
MALDKLAWAHLPELIVSSYYTSKACLIHSLPEGWRKDEDYRCPLCGEKVHADAHAAATLALLLLVRLRQVSSYVTNSPTGAPVGRKGPASPGASTTGF